MILKISSEFNTRFSIVFLIFGLSKHSFDLSEMKNSMYRCNVAREDIRQAHDKCRAKNPADRDERRAIENRFCVCVREGTGKTETEMPCPQPAKRQG